MRRGTEEAVKQVPISLIRRDRLRQGAAAVAVTASFAACAAAVPANEPTHSPDATVISGPWRDSFGFWICEAVGELDDAGDHVLALSDAANTMDLAVLVQTADAIDARVAEAQEAIDYAGRWPPADAVMKHLRGAATHYQRSVNLVKLGTQRLDRGVIEDGIEEAKEGRTRTSQGTKELPKMRWAGYDGC